jgi:glycosyltransferase involved in cell wall biosynthesis
MTPSPDSGGVRAAATPEYSVVIPIFNEQEVLPALFDRLTVLLEHLDGQGEVILVDDGSEDESLVHMMDVAARDGRFKVLQLSRNFGHQIAITAGLDFAAGNAVVVMDADLQDPPEVILELARRWREGFDVVYAVRRVRSGEKRFKRKTATAFYRLLRKLSDVDIPADVGDFRLVDRKALEAYKTMREEDRFVRGMFSWVGFKQVGVSYDRDERYAGDTKYPLRKMLQFAVNGIVSFSNAPLRLALTLGFIVSLASFVYGFVAITLKLVGAFTVPGWTSVILVTSFLGGVQLMVLGVIGEYVGKAYKETKKRPLYVVSGSVGLERLPAPDRTFVWPPAAEAGPRQRVSLQAERVDGKDGS